MAGFRQELVGLFGQPVEENPTQAMIEAGFAAAGLDWRYLTIEVAPEGLADAVRGARVMGLRGFNCTIPHKVAVVEHLDRLGRSAALMGAVNCVVRRGDELVGENTDGAGFLEAVRRRRDPAGARAVLLGAGGAARAIAVELALAGAAGITIVNRGAARGQELGALLDGDGVATGRPCRGARHRLPGARGRRPRRQRDVDRALPRRRGRRPARARGRRRPGARRRRDPEPAGDALPRNGGRTGLRDPRRPRDARGAGEDRLRALDRRRAGRRRPCGTRCGEAFAL